MSLYKSWEEYSAVVKKYYSFLENEYSYKITVDKEPYIIYESAKLKVVIFYDNGRWDFDIHIEPKKKSFGNDFSFSPESLQKLYRCDWTPIDEYNPPNDTTQFESIISLEANRLKNNCSTVLNGNLNDVNRLQELEYEFNKMLTYKYQHKKKNINLGATALTVQVMNEILKKHHCKPIN